MLVCESLYACMPVCVICCVYQYVSTFASVSVFFPSVSLSLHLCLCLCVSSVFVCVCVCVCYLCVCVCFLCVLCTVGGVEDKQELITQGVTGCLVPHPSSPHGPASSAGNSVKMFEV